MNAQLELRGGSSLKYITTIVTKKKKITSDG